MSGGRELWAAAVLAACAPAAPQPPEPVDISRVHPERTPEVSLEVTPSERVIVPTDSTAWTVGHSQRTDDRAILEFVRDHETIEGWTELLTLQAGIYPGQAMPRAFARRVADRTRASLEADCAGLVWAVLSEADSDVLYEWRHDGGKGNPPQHEIARVLQGASAVFVVRYTKKTPHLASDDRSRWLELIGRARMERSLPPP